MWNYTFKVPNSRPFSDITVLQKHGLYWYCSNCLQIFTFQNLQELAQLFAHWIVFSFLQHINFIYSSTAFSFHIILCHMLPKTVLFHVFLHLFFAALQVLLFPFVNANWVIFSDVFKLLFKSMGSVRFYVLEWSVLRSPKPAFIWFASL